MSVDLIILGVFQGLSWASLMPWEVSHRSLDPVLGGAAGGRAADVRGIACVRVQHLADVRRVSRRTAQEAGRRRGVMTGSTLQNSTVSSIEDSPLMLETKAGVLFIAGLGFFALAFLSNAVVPVMMYRDLPEQTVEQMLRHNGNLRFQFEDLARRFPDSFTAAYGRPPEDAAQREKWLDEKSPGGTAARATRSTSEKAAGTATASSSVPSPTRSGGGDRSPRPRNTRTSSSVRSCSAPGGSVPT